VVELIDDEDTAGTQSTMACNRAFYRPVALQPAKEDVSWHLKMETTMKNCIN
jgi:hypothetical protein